MKKKKVGIIGLGVVGSAIFKGFLDLGYDVIGHDIKENTKIENLLVCEIIFLCLPTKSNTDGSCDTSIVESCVSTLHDLNYKGIIAIKSTVEPNTTKRLIEQFNNTNICHVPEFLREKSAYQDFVENHNVLVIGTENDMVFEFIKNLHQELPKNVIKVSPTESEMMKYFSNSYKAMKVTFANTFFEICEHLNIDYQVIKKSFLLHGVKEHEYLNANKNLREFGGSCLPKDVLAINQFVDQNNLDLNIFEFLLSENKKFIK